MAPNDTTTHTAGSMRVRGVGAVTNGGCLSPGACVIDVDPLAGTPMAGHRDLFDLPREAVYQAQAESMRKGVEQVARFSSETPRQAAGRAANPDPIFRPAHYARFVIEPITFINANGLPYNIGNVIKYACRYDAKGGVEDLKKARRYLDIQIECLERKERVARGEIPEVVWSHAL